MILLPLFIAVVQFMINIGRFPLRHLVYRVHALPESMRSLVWDFGQLNPEVEELYTRQIVGRYVSRCYCSTGKIHLT